MKKFLLILCLALLAGCGAGQAVECQQGLYASTVVDPHSTVGWLAFDFVDDQHVQVQSPLSSYWFREADYEVSGRELKIRGVGLPSGEEDVYELVFETKDDSLVFREGKSLNYEIFQLKDGYVFAYEAEE